MIMDIILNMRSLADLARIMFYFITQFSYICKMINYVLNKKVILIVEGILEDPMLILHDQKQHAIRNNTETSIRRAAAVYRISVLSAVICFGLFSFLDKESESPLLVPGWFYIDVNVYAVEVVTYQLISMFVSAHYNSTMDIFAYSLIKLGSSEFEILQDSITNALNLNLKTRSTTEEDDVAIDRLKLCVEQHNILLKLSIV